MIGVFVGELFKFGNKMLFLVFVVEEWVVFWNGFCFYGDDDYMDGLVYGDDENEDLDYIVYLLCYEL